MLKKHLRKIIIDGKFQDSLSRALAINSLANCHGSNIVISKSIKKLLTSQRTDGGWENCVFFSVCNPLHPQFLFKWGSEELTTAFALEAISRYAQTFEKNSHNY